MKVTPSTHGRDGRGRFSAGNKSGRGNPLAGRAARLRAVLLERFTPEAAVEICDKLISQARGGDLASIKELFDRTIGRAVAFDVLDRLELLERRFGKRDEQ